MKKHIVFLLFVLTATIYYQCSYPEECDQIDWLGTYVLNTSDTLCTDTDGNNLFPAEILIEAGSDANKIIINGDEIDFDECFAFADFGTMTIDFGENRVSVSGCSSTYTKN